MGNPLPQNKLTIPARLPVDRKEPGSNNSPRGSEHATTPSDSMAMSGGSQYALGPLPPRTAHLIELPPDVNLDVAKHINDLTKENAQLHELLEQARERLDQAEKDAEQWKAREEEYEALLEEKSEVIRQLHLQMQEGAKHGAASGQAVATEDELMALQQELERERELLKQDEQAMMGQMREMEMQMARERADFARQRSELQRLQTELRHELEIASRDAALRERLAPLYKLQEEMQRWRASPGEGGRGRSPGGERGSGIR